MSVKFTSKGLADGTDETKELEFNVAGVTTATTRTITVPDADVDLGKMGKVLQVVQATSTTATNVAIGGSWTSISGASLTITPSSSSSKILISFNTGAYTNDAGNTDKMSLRIKRGTTVVRHSDRYAWEKGAYHSPAPIFYQYLDSPSTTSATTYTLEATASNDWWFFNSTGGTDSLVVIAMEIGA